MSHKLMLSFTALLALLSAAVPVSIKTYIYVVVVFVTIDSVTGFFTALVTREIRSSRFRTQFVVKAVQYVIILTIFGGASLITGGWWLAGLGLWVVICGEVQSMMESLIKLRKYGGIDFQGMNKYIDFIGKYFDIPERHSRDETSVSTVTVIPRDPDKGTVSSITTVQHGDNRPDIVP